MKAKIEELREELDLVKETLQAVECGISELDRAEDEPEFDVGDWVAIVKDDYRNNCSKMRAGDIFRIEEIYTSNLSDDIWLRKKRGENSGVCYCLCRKATPEEIEQALIKEAKRRGYEDGVIITDIEYGGRICLKGAEFCYYIHEDELFMESFGRVYSKGKWAEIIEDTITVNGYDAEFKEGYVQFGCAKIDNEVFDIHEELEVINIDHTKNGNRKIEAIKIGLGEFTIDQIKQIAERL